MKLGVLINNQSVLEKLYKTPLDGKRAFGLRKRIKKMNEEITTFNEARDEYIKTHGTERENGGVEIPQDDRKAVQAFVEYLNEMLGSEIDDMEPFFTEDDLAGMDLSVQEIDQIEALGLLKSEEKDSGIPEPKGKAIPAAEEQSA